LGEGTVAAARTGADEMNAEGAMNAEAATSAGAVARISSAG
jgi:hypothetical protein